MKKIAVVLSGCGFKDGAEITESIATFIAISQTKKAQYKVFAPNHEFTAKNHITDKLQETRNTLVESARISRGHIEELSALSSNDFDAVIFPGGFGAALYLCNFATNGAKSTSHPEAQRIVKEFYNSSKPIGAFCIAPALIATVLGLKKVSLTIGNDMKTAEEIKKTGAQHVECSVIDYVTDRENKIVTTPAYMYDKASSFEVFTGIQKAVSEIIEMA